MTREEYTRDFVYRVRYWLAQMGQEISDLEDRGSEKGDRWNDIMKYVEECEWVLVSVYDPTFIILNEDNTASFNFLSDWSDEELKQYLSDWETRWGVGQTPAVSLALESITVLNETTGGSGLNLPAGGQDGDRLIKSGNSLVWERPSTVFDMGENT